MDEHGKLRQIGIPEDVYEHPADDFVFRFLGIANFLPFRREGDALYAGDSRERWRGAPPDKADALLTAGFRPSDVILSRDASDGLPATIRRASFLGAQFDYLIEIAGALIRAALPSHECVARGLLFAEGDACRVNLATVQWFAGHIAAAEKL
jgi:iron(III) transport system ATP-binding protein